jgi:hypothetical protein
VTSTEVEDNIIHTLPISLADAAAKGVRGVYIYGPPMGTKLAKIDAGLSPLRIYKYNNGEAPVG